MYIYWCSLTCAVDTIRHVWTVKNKKDNGERSRGGPTMNDGPFEDETRRVKNPSHKQPTKRDIERGRGKGEERKGSRKRLRSQYITQEGRKEGRKEIEM